MSQSAKKHGSGCPVAFALDTFGDRWSLLVIRDLMLRGNETYGEFLESGEGIATNVLADRLKGLEAEGIIDKSPDPDNRRRNIYRLTDKGLDLAPVVMEMIRWAGKYDSSREARKGNVRLIENDSDGFLASLRSRLTGDIQ
ncbi:MAG: helix-turn-helix transcriptional regulator [Rhodospirillaceae bacterium]|jgi:DNA-binding HxlR family transcriptional regulator|nr:helix-turn-helix transcriptional regulator [Rhodospirillaceae bacterium]MBT5562998.1 helix-turn-helix transcriptional regulator [Rhodospirillaceae bacterium]MBT6242666.1 helix-turn-helix transcriptional regulator [Rhodospirillaceae bacterium]MBT7137403.1 helix-turn-helix transcriptional regulator [Rhodospirillaceae bacterium]